jgi:hypothetical protein
MRLRVPHTYDFGAARDQVGADLVTPAGWDAARAVPGPFALATTRAEWRRLAERDDLARRAADIVEIVRQIDAATLCSHGVGTALLEANVQRLAPSLRLVCTDYAPRTVERLRQLFPEAEILLRDLTAPAPPPADLHLMHRLDAELDDAAWQRVFAALPEPILFVPNVLLDLKGALRELARPVVRVGRVTRAGWFRNEAALRSLWRSTHRDTPVEVGGAPAFLLEPRRSSGSTDV